MTGTVNQDGVPEIPLIVAGRSWAGIVDTGFNGDLELPQSLQPLVNAHYHTQMLSVLAGGQVVLEDLYRVAFPFDGGIIAAEATFTPGSEILLGTNLLDRYHLDIHFPNRTVLLERVA